MSTNTTAAANLFTKPGLPPLDGLIIVILPILTALINGIIFITITHFGKKDLSRASTSEDLEMLKDAIPDDNNASGRSVKAKVKKGGLSKTKKGQSAASKKAGDKNKAAIAAKQSAEAKKSAKGFAFDVPEKEDVGTLVGATPA
ncbi:hypothetical protein PFISCL1PPCAC_17379 [Pristionchus fissidentatus]|uniref:Uncharacterized protein n=1 Tax=Pristionchus fissidentatus TaxID=1538716 RepID=A0AAV5W7M2_9BILA|nr:hypothetical protein PFISCL1PPCAC_17379 [Pristionchus fissidentatus]